MEEIRALLSMVLKGAGCGFLILSSKLGSEQAALHTHGDSQRAQQRCGSFSLPRPDSTATRTPASLAQQLLGSLACCSGEPTVWEHLSLKAGEKKRE